MRRGVFVSAKVSGLPAERAAPPCPPASPSPFYSNISVKPPQASCLGQDQVREVQRCEWEVFRAPAFQRAEEFCIIAALKGGRRHPPANIDVVLHQSLGKRRTAPEWVEI